MTSINLFDRDDDRKNQERENDNRSAWQKPIKVEKESYTIITDDGKKTVKVDHGTNTISIFNGII